MLKPIEAQTMERFHCLVLGESGAGKTSLIKTLPKGENTWILSAESGLLPIIDLIRSGQVGGWEITSKEDMDAAISALKTPEWQASIKWLVVDSLSEIAGIYEEHFSKKFPDRKDSFPKWGAYNEHMSKLVRELRDLRPYNIVMTCGVSVEFDEVKRRHILPNVPGKGLKELLPYIFDELLFLAKDEKTGERLLYTDKFGSQPGKDRSGKLSLTEPPDLSLIRQKILGE